MANLTLADYSENPYPLISGVADVLRKASPLMDNMQFINAGALNIEVIRQAGRPTVSWRKAGNPHGSSKGRVDLVKETAFSLGNYIDVDKVYVKNGNALYDARALWTKQTVESMAFAFNYAFLYGDPAIDEDSITGLWVRLQNEMVANKIAAGGLDISTDSATLVASTNSLFDLLDQLLYELPDGGKKVLVMNKTMLQRYWSLSRQSGLLSSNKDQLGRIIIEYNGAMLIDAGYKVDGVTPIIGNVENVNGGVLTGGAATSMFGMTLGAEYLTGFQEYPMDVEDMGLLEDGVTYRTVVDWVVGIAASHPRSIYQLHGIVAA